MIKKVVLFGDSMIDTFDFMGSGFLELQKELQKLSPGMVFDLKNHGIGQTGVDIGLKRLVEPYEYEGRGRSLPSIIDENPDLVILESFAYNYLHDDPDCSKYLATHEEIIKTLSEKTKAKILLLATIAPSRAKYASAVLLLNWPEERRVLEVAEIEKRFVKFVEFAKTTGLPFVDLHSKSVVNNDGNLTYISNVDYIHLSFEGREFVSQNIAPEIIKLLS